MKAISLYQPWASLMAHGKKLCETRSWPTSYRGPLLIHAAKKWEPELALIAAKPLFFRPKLEACGVVFDRDEDKCRRGWNLPFGAIVGRVDLVDVYPTKDIREGLRGQAVPHHGEWGRHLFVNMVERAFGDFSANRFAWLCANAVAFPEPIPFRGAQGLFDVPDELIANQLREPA